MRTRSGWRFLVWRRPIKVTLGRLGWQWQLLNADYGDVLGRKFTNVIVVGIDLDRAME